MANTAEASGRVSGRVRGSAPRLRSSRVQSAKRCATSLNTAEELPITTAKKVASMLNSKICIATLLLPLAGALQQMRLATSSTMAPHWQPKPAPAPLVDAPAAPALSVEAAMRIMFDPVGRGKVRHGAYIKLSWRVAIDATSGVLVAPDSTIDSRTGAAARREAAGLDGPDGGLARGLRARDCARGAE